MTDDLALIVEAALRAGRTMLERREEGLTVEYKTGNSPVTNADMEIDAFLKETLRAARPDYGWLSEETLDDPERLGRRRLFVVDPIDGTRAYIKGRPWFSVSIAVVDDGASVAGVVHAPALGETYVATAGGGATLNGAPIAPSSQRSMDDCAMIGDAAVFAHPAWPRPWPPMRVESRNSLAYRMCLVACGAFDAAVSPGGKSDWDLAAGDLIAREAGAVACDLRGRPMVYNRPVPRQDGMLCAAPALAPLIVTHMRPIDQPRESLRS